MRKILLVLLLIGFDAYGNERECLAENVYFEARGQGQAGWVAVAQVTLNRVQDTRFPNTICEVVKQGLTYESGHPIKNKCQFSWYCDGKSDKVKILKVYSEINELINMFLTKSYLILLVVQLIIMQIMLDQIGQKLKLKRLRLKTIFFTGGKNNV